MTKSGSRRPNKLLYRSSTGQRWYSIEKETYGQVLCVCKEFEIEWLQDHGKCYKDSCEFQGCDMRPKCGYLHQVTLDSVNCTYDIIFACHGTTVANKCIVRDITDTFLYFHRLVPAKLLLNLIKTIIVGNLCHITRHPTHDLC